MNDTQLETTVDIVGLAVGILFILFLATGMWLYIQYRKASKWMWGQAEGHHP